MPRAPLALAAALAGLAACAPEFTPRSVLEDVRVLALVAEPPEIGLAGTTSVTAYAYVPVGATVTWSWSFCPYSLGSSAGYACIVPECEQDLPPGNPVAIAPQVETGLFLACVAALSGGAPPPGLPAQPPEVVEMVVRYTGRDAGGSVLRQAVQLIPVHTLGPPPAPNHNPVMQAVSIGGQAVPPPPGGSDPVLLPGGELEVRALLGDPETYLDPAGRTAQEQLVVSFFTTAGRFDYDRALGPDARVKLKHESIAPGTTGVQVWAVARDLRGGEAIAGPFDVAVGP